MKVKPPTHIHVRAAIKAGYPVVAGVDEVGRGCWAGPVVAGAVILPLRLPFRGVTDSKLLSHQRRVELARLIKRYALAVGIGWVHPADIDARGLTWAVRQSGLRALADMNYAYDAVLLDGNHNYLRGEACYSETIIKGDQKSFSIAAASIVAKVARDQYMIRHHLIYPEYDFAGNKGYGTPRHAEAVRFSLSPLHRRLFKPVQLASAGFFESLDFNHDYH